MQRTATISLYNVFSFVSRCYLYLPIFILWFLRQGLTQFQVMALVSVYFVSALVAEIPAGLFADRCGRKWALCVGSIAQSLGACCLATTGAWWLYAVGELCLGMGNAFHTGAKEALLFDHLKERGAPDAYQRVYGEAKFFEFAGMSVGALSGTLLYVYGGWWPFVASAGVFALGAVVAAMMREPAPSRALARHWRQDIRDGWCEVRQGAPTLRCLIGYYVWFFSLVLIVTVTLSQPYLTWIGFPLRLFGWAYLFFNLLAMAGTVWAERLGGHAPSMRFFGWLGAGFALIVAILALWHRPFAFLVLGGIYLGWGLLLPTVSYGVNRLVDSPHRATVLAIQDFAQGGVFVVTALVMGAVTDHCGLPATLATLAAISSMAILCTVRRN